MLLSEVSEFGPSDLTVEVFNEDLCVSTTFLFFPNGETPYEVVLHCSSTISHTSSQPVALNHHRSQRLHHCRGCQRQDQDDLLRSP
jgi:hypothetical protein